MKYPRVNNDFRNWSDTFTDDAADMQKFLVEYVDIDPQDPIFNTQVSNNLGTNIEYVEAAIELAYICWMYSHAFGYDRGYNDMCNVTRDEGYDDGYEIGFAAGVEHAKSNNSENY